MTAIKSLSFTSRVVMDMHALNNEGSESNRLMTRQATIITPIQEPDENENNPEYLESVVNAISGDMNKHIFALHLRDIAMDMGLPVCEACQALDPARMMGNADFADYITGGVRPADEVIDHLLSCVVDDVCGIMITAGKNSIKRKSAVEFGWTVGLPDYSKVQEFVHARHAINRLTRTKATRDSDDATKEKAAQEKGANLGQMIFDRPASSGVYAFVAYLDIASIGFNDSSQEYIDQAQRDLRLKATLSALAQTLLHPKGALTSTQLPHIVGVEGYVSISESAITAPLVSPLTPDFIEQANERAKLSASLHPNANITVLNFANSQELLHQFVQISQNATAGTYR